MSVALLVPVAVLAVQVDFAFSENFQNFAFVDQTPWRDILSLWNVRNGVEYRVLYFPLVKLIWTFAGPNLLVWRAAHLLMLAALVALVVRIANRLGSGLSVAASVCLLTSLLGLHTFRFLLLGFPLNMYLMVAVAVVGIVLVGLEPEWRWRNAIVVVLSLGSLLMLETGIIACAIVVLGGIVRPRRYGASAVWIVLIGVALYGAVRFALNGAPMAFFSETGFGFRELSVEEQRQSFGVFPVLLYVYNSATAVLSLLFSMPRAGVFNITGGLLGAEGLRAPLPWQWLNLATSVVGTAFIAAWFRWSRASADEKFVKRVVLLVIVFNAGLSYLYTRDRIMATAGIFYALAFGASVQLAIERRRLSPHAWPRTIATLLVFLTLAWSWRGATVLVALRDAAWSTQREWSARFEQLGGLEPDPDPRAAQLKQTLRERNLRRTLTDPETDPAFSHRWFERQF